MFVKFELQVYRSAVEYEKKFDASTWHTPNCTTTQQLTMNIDVTKGLGKYGSRHGSTKG